MSGDFGGSVVLVTGSSRGIGRAVAAAFCQQGATVLVHARTAAAAEEARADLGAGGALGADLRRPDEIAAMFSAVRARWGRLDVLVGNAGISLSGPLAEQEPDRLRELVHVNVRAPWLCAQHALDLMPPGGLILHMSSDAGTTPLPLLCAYSASKAALDALSAGLRAPAARRGIKVLVLAPGAVDTAMGEAQDEEFARRHNQGIRRLPVSAVAEAALAMCRLARQGEPRHLLLGHEATT